MNFKYSSTIGIAVALLVGLLSGASLAAQNDSAPALADQLKGQYKLAKMGSDSGGSSVVEAGDVFDIQKGGILGVPPCNVATAPATYKDGDLHSPGAFAVG